MTATVGPKIGWDIQKLPRVVNKIPFSAMKGRSGVIEHDHMEDSAPEDRKNFPFAKDVPQECQILSCQLMPAAVLEMTGGVVSGKAGAVFHVGEESDVLIAETFMDWGPFIEQCPIPKLDRRKLCDEKGVLAVAAVKYSDCYYHWMLELLPRISLCAKFGYDRIYLKSSGLPFQEETLEIFGLEKWKIVQASDDAVIRAEKLLVPSYPGPYGYVPRWVCDLLREMFLPEQQEPCQNIYITRSKARSRRIVNEEEVCAILKENGFKVFELETLTVIEQAKLFSSGKCIISSHGASLANLVFCHENTKVLELFSPQWVNPCYWRLSNLLKLDYFCMLGNQEGLGIEQLLKNDILVNLEDLRSQLSMIGCQKSV